MPCPFRTREGGLVEDAEMAAAVARSVMLSGGIQTRRASELAEDGPARHLSGVDSGSPRAVAALNQSNPRVPAAFHVERPALCGRGGASRGMPCPFRTRGGGLVEDVGDGGGGGGGEEVDFGVSDAERRHPDEHVA